MKNTVIILIAAVLLLSCEGEPELEPLKIETLAEWVDAPVNRRNELSSYDFSKKALSKEEAAEATELLLRDKQNRIDAEIGDQWDARQLQNGTLQMPFFYQTFGTQPADGHSLYISLHGGGGTTAEINNQQYENQKRLYNETMSGLEGIYLAPRAPTDTWNLWHMSHIDTFLSNIIQLAMIKEDINPNKVYLLGYSAGGDGVYQLAPRMADRFAAASMMAGHPNDANPLSLRNLPFAIQVGALDDAFDRNKVAGEWNEQLDALQAADPEGYEHFYKLHEGLGHWMELQDAPALPWMSQFTRNPNPTRVVWKQDDVNHTDLYWLSVPVESATTGGVITAVYEQGTNTINIEENYSGKLYLMLNDSMLDLDREVTVQYQNQTIFQGNVSRSMVHVFNTMDLKGDPGLAFSAVLEVEDNQKVVIVE